MVVTDSEMSECGQPNREKGVLQSEQLNGDREEVLNGLIK